MLENVDEESEFAYGNSGLKFENETVSSPIVANDNDACEAEAEIEKNNSDDNEDNYAGPERQVEIEIEILQQDFSPEEIEDGDDEDETIRNPALDARLSTNQLFSDPLLDCQVYDNSQVNLKTCSLMLIDWHHTNQISLTALEELLKFLAFVILPTENLMPSTIYQLHKLLGIDVDRYEEHICINECHYFPKVEKRHWKQHENETCPNCGIQRFITEGQSIRPHKKFYRIPLSEQLQNVSYNPKFFDSIESMKERILEGLTANDSFWGASLVQDLRGLPDFEDKFLNRLIFSIGLDSVQCFKESRYSVTPVGFRCWNLDPAQRTSKGFVLVTTLIPNGAKNLQTYLIPTFNEFNTLGKGKTKRKKKKSER